MSRLGFTIVAASLLFGSVSGLARDRSATSAVRDQPNSSGLVVDPLKYARLFREAPVGHRQPRPSEVPETTELSPRELELRRLDEEIDRKLVICRGC
jgi:hypothetical protein